MKKGERLHDLFYGAARRASGNAVGQKILSAAAPLLRQIFPREKTTRSTEEIFAELGYAPDVFQALSTSPVRAYAQDLKGLLSFSGHQDIIMISEFFSDEMPASAIMPIRPSAHPDKDTNYIVLSDINVGEADYRRDISDMSGLPERMIERLEGCPRLSKAMTIGHEITHFDIGSIFDADPACSVEIESYCDAMPHVVFQKAADPEVYERTGQESILARAIFPIVEAVAVSQKGIELPCPDVIYGHATALLLDNPSLLSEERPGKTVIEAYKTANMRLTAVLDADSTMPIMLSCYCAAKDVLDDLDLPHDHARRALELYVEGIEYFSPGYADKALKLHVQAPLREKSQHVQRDDSGDLSLEI